MQFGKRGSVIAQEAQLAAREEIAWKDRSWALALGSLLFALLQSACTAVMAISGLRLVIGVGSLAAASGGLKFMAAIHGDAIRIPMLLFAVVGSLLNLYSVWLIRSLRARPAARWRVSPIAPEKKRAENLQIALAILTLLLVAAECAAHVYLKGSA